MKKKFRLLLSVLTVAVVIVSCSNPFVYDRFQSIPAAGWNKDSVLVFEIPACDTLQNHNLYISVRNDIDYKYSNLWLFVKIIQPGNEALTDTFEITLADPAGKWLGEGFGGRKTRQVVYKHGVYFPVSGNYTIRIQHGMRENVLKGITDIGLQLEKTN